MSKRKAAQQSEPEAAAPEQQQPGAVPVDQPTDGTDFDPAKLEQRTAAPAEGQPEEQGEARKPFVSRLPDPHGRHFIDVGEGRFMRLFLDRKYRQNAIKFYAAEGDNPKPDAETIDLLHKHGWQWRGEEKVWTRQLARDTQEEPYARARSDREAEDSFVELAHAIRARKGLPPTEYSFGEQRSAGR
jgi:hypothetical protein